MISSCLESEPEEPSLVPPNTSSQGTRISRPSVLSLSSHQSSQEESQDHTKSKESAQDSCQPSLAKSSSMRSSHAQVLRLSLWQEGSLSKKALWSVSPLELPSGPQSRLPRDQKTLERCLWSSSHLLERDTCPPCSSQTWLKSARICQPIILVSDNQEK